MHHQRQNYPPDIFFHKIDFSNKPPPPVPVDFDALGDYSDLTAEIVDPVIEFEVDRLHKKYIADEENYVDINLRENPIIWYNRIQSSPSSPSPAKKSIASTSKAAKLQQLKKLSDCTRCKMLSKIKKAKFKLRYKFLMTKLEQNAGALQNLRNCIAGAEANLRCKGRSEEDLRKLREAMGIDRVRVQNLPEINRMIFRAAENELE
ncbi:protein sisterless A-like [Eupeodes corollae]|uniref:protein sisterless A-like n=1 Tax=Eupeodes corollae TaxID=290404 RepID=UPI0024921998|nr:protein sisterless A-like [Eupeodes corollae]